MSKDVVPIVSFPKSGNTWVRFLLANLLKKDQDLAVDFENINHMMPTSLGRGESVEHFIEGTPLFVKSHSSYYDMLYRDFDKAIYIYRDGFDALYSYWHFTDAQSPGLYPNVEVFSKCYWSYCGHWGRHLYSWIVDEKTKKSHKVLAFSYERLMGETTAVLREVADFLCIDVSEERIARAVQLSDKKNMKKMSGSKDFMKSRKKGFHFVRSANKGEAKEMLPESCKRKFLNNSLNYELMTKFGYLDVSNQSYRNKKGGGTPIFDRILRRFYNVKFRLYRFF